MKLFVCILAFVTIASAGVIFGDNNRSRIGLELRSIVEDEIEESDALVHDDWKNEIGGSRFIRELPQTTLIDADNNLEDRPKRAFGVGGAKFGGIAVGGFNKGFAVGGGGFKGGFVGGAVKKVAGFGGGGFVKKVGGFAVGFKKGFK